MHDKFKKLTLAAGIALASLAAISVAHSEEVMKGLVVNVHDGDTLTIVDDLMKKHNIRLSGIDAPELVQRFGGESMVSLYGMTHGKNVAVYYEKEDMHGRILGRVVVDDVDVNSIQVKKGMAWAYRTCNKYHLCRPNKDALRHIGEERDAINMQTGLWKDPNPEAPWDYRRSKKPQ